VRASPSEEERQSVLLHPWHPWHPWHTPAAASRHALRCPASGVWLRLFQVRLLPRRRGGGGGRGPRAGRPPQRWSAPLHGRVPCLTRTRVLKVLQGKAALPFMCSEVTQATATHGSDYRAHGVKRLKFSFSLPGALAFPAPPPPPHDSQPVNPFGPQEDPAYCRPEDVTPAFLEAE